MESLWAKLYNSLIECLYMYIHIYIYILYIYTNIHIYIYIYMCILHDKRTEPSC